MPLLQFSVNTDIQGVNQHSLLGSNGQGSFEMSHRLRSLPPPETEYTLKHVVISSSGHSTTNQRRSTPTTWVGIDFPQLDADIIARRDNIITVQDRKPDPGFEIQPQHINTRGTLRFPITTYPVDGILKEVGTSINYIDSNRPSRFSINTSAGRNYLHKGTHIMNIPLGRMRLDEDVLKVVLTPYDARGKIFTETVGSDRIARTHYIQIILEYK